MTQEPPSAATSEMPDDAPGDSHVQRPGDLPGGPPLGSSRDTTTYRLVQALGRYSEASDRVTELAGSLGGHHRTDLRALAVLMRRQSAGLETTPSDLGRLLHLTSASTTALVDRLVSMGHAERERSQTDRRRVLVRHTETASRDGRAIFAPLSQHLMHSLAGYTPEQMRTAIDILESATASMDEAEDELRSASPPHTTGADPA